MKYKNRQKHKRKVNLQIKWSGAKLWANMQRMKKEDQSLPEETVGRRRAKKKYPCKRLKGEHSLEIVEEKDYASFVTQPFRVIKRECTACGKKETEFINI